jgi:hypothetical protein
LHRVCLPFVDMLLPNVRLVYYAVIGKDGLVKPLSVVVQNQFGVAQIVLEVFKTLLRTYVALSRLARH